MNNSTPENAFDEWFSDSHQGTKASWEDEEEIPDYEIMVDEYED